MLNENSKKISCTAWMWIAGTLAFIVLLENLTLIFPGAPAVFKPTSQLFTVLKKAARIHMPS